MAIKGLSQIIAMMLVLGACAGQPPTAPYVPPPVSPDNSADDLNHQELSRIGNNQCDRCIRSGGSDCHAACMPASQIASTAALPPVPPAPPPAPPTLPPPLVPPPAPVAASSRAVAIEYYNGQPLVRIGVGQIASFRCVLDTGADSLVVPYQALEQLGARGMTDADIAVTGGGNAELAGGAHLRTARVIFREIDIGPWRLHLVPATITPAGDCLLGMSILAQFGHPVIDLAGQRLILDD